MVKILWANRHPEMDLDPASKKESFLYNFGEHFQDNNSPQNDIHSSNIDTNQSESTTKPFKEVLDDLGSKVERVDHKLTSGIEGFGLKQHLNNSDKETNKTVKNQTLISSSNLKPALSVKDVFKRIPTDVGKFSQDFTRIGVQPSGIPQVRTSFKFHLKQKIVKECYWKATCFSVKKTLPMLMFFCRLNSRQQPNKNFYPIYWFPQFLANSPAYLQILIQKHIVNSLKIIPVSKNISKSMLAVKIWLCNGYALAL